MEVCGLPSERATNGRPYKRSATFFIFYGSTYHPVGATIGRPPSSFDLFKSLRETLPDIAGRVRV